MCPQGHPSARFFLVMGTKCRLDRGSTDPLAFFVHILLLSPSFPSFVSFFGIFALFSASFVYSCGKFIPNHFKRAGFNIYVYEFLHDQKCPILLSQPSKPGTPTKQYSQLLDLPACYTAANRKP